MTDSHDIQQGQTLTDADPIVCSACDGEGPYSEDGCVECVSTGYQLDDEHWEIEYTRWERRMFRLAPVEADDDLDVGRRFNEYLRAHKDD